MNSYESDPLKHIKSMSPLEFESLKFGEESLSTFESKLDWFFQSDVDLITLFKADIKSVNYGGSFGYDESPLEYIAPKGKGRVKVSVLTSGFHLLFRDCLKTPIQDPVIERTEEPPFPFTNGLKDFIIKNPTLKINIASATYDISDNEEETDLIIHRRYSDPLTKYPIADIWQAERILHIDYPLQTDEIQRAPVGGSPLRVGIRQPAFSGRR